MQVRLLMQSPPDPLQVSRRPGQAGHRLGVQITLAPDGRHPLLCPGDRRLDHQHGLANLTEHPFALCSGGVDALRHFHGIESSRREWFAGSPGRPADAGRSRMRLPSDSQGDLRNPLPPNRRR
jgi:hypothetical protein